MLEVLSVLFYASLKTEEGRSIQVHVFYADPEHKECRGRDDRPAMWKFFSIDRIPFTVQDVVKLAKAADPWSTGLAIYKGSDGKLYVWAILDQNVHFNTSLVHEGGAGYLLPGAFHAVVNGIADLTVMVSHDFVARLAQDSIVKHENGCFWAGPVYRRLIAWANPMFAEVEADTDCSFDRDDAISTLQGNWINSLQRILIHIKRQRHGGSLLIMPGSLTSETFIKYPISYPRVSNGVVEFTRHEIQAKALRRDIDAEGMTISKSKIDSLRRCERQLEEIQNMLTGAIRCVASFAGVDGAVLLNERLECLGFGAILGVQRELTEVFITSMEKFRVASSSPARFGTRHGSVMKYCAAYPDTMGFVVSQDGDVRVVTNIEDRCAMFDNVALRGFENLPIGPLIRPKIALSRSR